MRQRRLYRDVLPYVAGAFTALAGLKLLAPRLPAQTGADWSGQTGRGAPTSPPSAESLQAGYDIPDAEAGRIGWVMVIFAASAIVAVALMVLLLSLLHHGDAALDASLTPEQRTQSAPPLPHLQADPLGELASLRAAESAKLQGYARIDAATARIPIGRAMALVTGQSLDAHADPDPAR